LEQLALEEKIGEADATKACPPTRPPEQNHVCAYQQSLERSIGTRIYPAVNVFTANEWGVLSLVLSKIKNSVGYFFSLSKDVPQLMDKCTKDQAVAELITIVTEGPVTYDEPLKGIGHVTIPIDK